MDLSKQLGGLNDSVKEHSIACKFISYCKEFCCWCIDGDNSGILDLLNGTKERLHAVKGGFMKIMKDSGILLKWLYIESTNSPFLSVRMYMEGKKGRFNIVCSDENGILTRSGIHCDLNVREAMNIFKEYSKQIEAYDNR